MTTNEETKNLNKLMFLSNAPWASTGYGNQMQIFLTRIQDLGYSLAMCAFWGLQGGMLQWGKNIPILPPGLMAYGQDIAPAHAKNFGAKYLISLIDAWIFNEGPFFESLSAEGVRWIPWFPVDSEPLPPRIKVAVERAYKRVVYSKFACEQLDAAGLDYTYIPHGVDTKIFHPVDQLEAREWLRTHGRLNIPDDAYLVGMVAANKGTPSRKAFMPQMRAFAEFKKSHPDAVLYLHTTPGVMGEFGGENLVEYAEHLGLRYGIDVLFPDRYGYFMGMPDQYMRNAYAAMDVHMLVSMGEGFGIPIVEAQACGTPVIVGDWTSMPELCFSGWKVPKEQADKWWTPQATYQYMPRVAGVVEALEKAYQMRGNMEYRTRARDGAMQYDADRVTEKYWKPFLAELFADDEAAEKEIAEARERMQKRIKTNG